MTIDSRITRRSLLKRAAIGAASIGLAACQPKVVEKVVKETVIVEQEKVVEKEVTSVPAGNAPVEVSILCRAGYGGDPVRLFVSKFNNTYPDIQAHTVDVAYAEQLKKIQAMYAAGNSADVIYTMVKYGPYLTHQGIHMSLNDLADRYWDEFNFDDFFPSALGALTFEDQLYALPEWTSPTSRPLIVYNIDMFEEAGIDIPPMEGWSIFDWRDAAVKLSKPDKGIFGVSPPSFTNYYDWDAIVDMFGGHILKDEVGLAKKFDFVDNPESIAAWEWFKSMMIDNHAAPRRGESVEKINMFTAGMLATTKDGLYHLPGLPKEVGDRFRYGITLMEGPVRKGGGMFVQGFGLTSQTKHPDEAFKLAVFQTDTEVGVWSATTGVGMGLQGRKSQWTHESVLAMNPIYGLCAEWMSGDVAPFPQPYNLRYQEVFDVYANATDKLSFGEVSWEEQAPIVQQKVQELLDTDRP